MSHSYEPLRTFNFVFTIPELKDGESFRLGVSSLSWFSAIKQIDLYVKLFEDTNKRSPFEKQLFYKKSNLTGKLELLSSKAKTTKVFIFKGLKLKNAAMQLSYHSKDNSALEWQLSFTYTSVA